jgi:hypothetical protein
MPHGAYPEPGSAGPAAPTGWDAKDGRARQIGSGAATCVYSPDRSVRRRSLIVAMTGAVSGHGSGFVKPTLTMVLPATEVARRAGHGVAVLLKIYAHCVDGQADDANQRITGALGAKDTEPEPDGEEDADSEMAS